MSDKLTKLIISKLMTDELIGDEAYLYECSDGSYSAAALETWYIENHPHDDRFSMIADVAKLVADFCNATLNTVSMPRRWRYHQ